MGSGTVLDRRLLVVTGKGGVGKTTVAGALGLLAARAGRRTIVAEVARRTDVAGAFGTLTGTFEERELAPGLFHISVDPQDALEEYLRDQLPGALAEALRASRAFTLLAAATPGLRELLTVGKLWELAQLERRTPGAAPYDLVVVDAPATGHGVAVLGAPRAFAGAAGAGPIARQARVIDATLADPEQTAIVAVTLAEELAVGETLALRDTLRDDLGLDVHAVVANALEPDRFTDQEVALLRGHERRPAVAAALAEHRRARRQRAQVARLEAGTGLAAVPVARCVGGPDLAAMAADLERAA